MRCLFLTPACLSALLLVACQPSRAPHPQPPRPTQASSAPEKNTRPTRPEPLPASEATPKPTPASAPTPALSAPKISSKTISGIQFEGVSYDSRSHHLRVVDQPDGPGTRYVSSEDLAQKTGALLAINAGFFTPEGKPLGWLISDGKSSGAWNNTSSLGSGIYLENTGGHTAIRRRSSRAAVANSRQLLQAGPLLIENSTPIAGLDPEKTALRSIILTDGGNRWWIGKTSSCSLAQLARALAAGSPAPWKVAAALNLDGGRSTDLYISSQLPGGPLNRRGFFNRPVRNFLILTPRR